MYPILISIDHGIYKFMEFTEIDLLITLKFAILKHGDSKKCYFHLENHKNIRLNLESVYFLILNSICQQNNSYMNVIGGELVLEMLLDILKDK